MPAIMADTADISTVSIPIELIGSASLKCQYSAPLSAPSVFSVIALQLPVHQPIENIGKISQLGYNPQRFKTVIFS
jgi:hypothetical protein